MAVFDWDVVDDFFTPDFVETCTYATVDYDCIRYKRDEKYLTMQAGESQDILFSLMTKVEDFTPVPEQPITFNDVVYLISAVSKDSTGKTYRVDLVEQYG